MYKWAVIFFFWQTSWLSSVIILNPSVVKMYTNIKLTHKPKYMLFGINPLNKLEIIITKNASANATYDTFVKDLDQVAKARECSWAIYDFNYTDPTVNQTLNKIVYYLWVPEVGSVIKKITYTSTNTDVKKAFIGIGVEIQASTLAQVSFAQVLAKCLKSA